MSDEPPNRKFRAATLQDALDLASDMEERAEISRAESVYRKLLERRPDEGVLFLRLGGLLLRAGRAVEAAETLSRAESLTPRSADTLVLLARALERARRPYDAIDALHRATGLEPNRADARALLHTVARRVTRLEEDADRLRSTIGQQVPARLRGAALLELASTFDAMGLPDDALKALQQGQQTLSLSPESMRFGRDLLPAQIRAALAGLSDGMTRAWRAPDESDSIDVVALVGLLPAPSRALAGLFAALPGLQPRSGAPVLALLAQAAEEISAGLSEDPARLAALPEAQLDSLRARFRRLAADAGAAADGVALLDVSPVGLLRLPLLRRLWPHARVVFAHHDPRDEALACLFQRRRPSALSVHLHQPPAAAAMLVDLWRLWKRLRATLDMHTLELSVVDLLASPEREGRRLADFLARPWPAPADHWSREVHASSVREDSPPDIGPGRWRMYSAFLSGALTPLEPVAREMGYTT